jgi:serine protease Do
MGRSVQMRDLLRRCLAVGLAVGIGLATPIAADAKSRTVALTRAVFRMDEGLVWGHIGTSADCDQSRETLRWGREGSEMRTERLGAAFRQVFDDFSGGRKDENLFEDAPAASDLQIAVAISDMRGSFCDQPGQAGVSGSLSMTVEWQLYDPAARRLIAKFETHATGHAGDSTLGGLEGFLSAAFRQNARDLMSDSAFQRALKQAPGEAAKPSTDSATHISLSTAGAGPRPLPEAVQSVVLVSTSDGHGSGFLISNDGYILTNAHVIAGGGTVRIRWPDGTEVDARVLRSNVRRDVALLKVESPPHRPLALRMPLPGQGDSVFAIGAPLDPRLQGTLTRGIVSATRLVDGQAFIQSDVSVTHGNSGGPLLNERGEVLGMTDMGFMAGDASLGLNMFIPINDALHALGLEPPPAPSRPLPMTAHRQPARR